MPLSFISADRARAGGAAVLRHGRATRCRLAEVAVADRPPVIRRYLQVAPEDGAEEGGRHVRTSA